MAFCQSALHYVPKDGECLHMTPNRLDTFVTSYRTFPGFHLPYLMVCPQNTGIVMLVAQSLFQQILLCVVECGRSGEENWRRVGFPKCISRWLNGC
jgi:hypothetical protein